MRDLVFLFFFRMKAPSFFIAVEDESGMTMEYRSKRRGFQYYVQGQVKEISKNFAVEIKKLEMELKKQEVRRIYLIECISFSFPRLFSTPL